MSGTLFIVATPIGNLEDLTPRARQIARSKWTLLQPRIPATRGDYYRISGSKRGFWRYTITMKQRLVPSVIAALESGQSVALVSDAGTPLVSDPGYRLVQAAHRTRCARVAHTGPSALTAALSVAGLPTDRFCFEGFLPAKKNSAARRVDGSAE